MDKKEFVIKTGEIIRKARNAKKISMEDLADKINISYPSLSAIERGIQDDIKSFTLFSLIKELDINPSLIFDESDLSKEKLNIFKNISALDDSEIAKFKEFKSLISKIFASK